nr:hypothetical protein [Pirellula sp.]
GQQFQQVEGEIVVTNVTNEIVSSNLNVNLPVDGSDAMELDIVHCQPESQMLMFEFESVSESIDEQQRTEYKQVLYRSNYQSRPRGPMSDVDVCFGGKISVSRLRTDLR